jgi:glycosyltransferase involved in cell wall biosynthesis
MHCPTLEQLPAPPHGKTGWPWTEHTKPTAGSDQLRISIVTASYNQAHFLEETIRSVLLQGYPNLEYIILDAASTDGSVKIIRKYEKYLAHWTSERDNGASDAIAKGFARATGSILAWLNSDDIYLPGALRLLIDRMTTARADVAYGNTYWIDEESGVLAERRQTPFSKMAYLYGGADLQQPSTIWSANLYRAVGGMDPAFNCAFDTDLFSRFIAKGAKFAYVRQFVSCARLQAAQKTQVLSETCRKELDKIRSHHLPAPVRSLRGVLLRNLGRMQRLAWYSIQGDLPWLIGRIPDRLKSHGNAAQVTGPRSKWV